MNRRILATSLLLMALAKGVNGQDAFVSLKDLGHGSSSLEGHFFVKAPAEVAWNVLTDYDHISDFVSSMEHSRIECRTDEEVRVRQKASGRFFLFERATSVLLDIHEKPFEKIQFEDISGEDFHRYVGFWKIESTGDELLVRYSLELNPRFSVPGFVKRRVIKQSVTALLEQVKTEVKKRAAK
jgi:hypothetical protein